MSGPTEAPPSPLAGVRRWYGRRATHRRAVALGAALLLGVALLVPVNSPRPAAIAYMLLLLAVLALVMRFRVGGLVIGVLLLAGVHLRIDAIGIGHSDVLQVTERAIDVMRAGANPYALGTAATMPGSPPFPYGPLALVWYVPAADPQLLEMAVAIGLLLVLGLRGRPIGLAFFALAPPPLLTFSDGSNDHSAGLLLLVALLALRRSPEWASGYWPWRPPSSPTRWRGWCRWWRGPAGRCADVRVDERRTVGSGGRAVGRAGDPRQLSPAPRICTVSATSRSVRRSRG